MQICMNWKGLLGIVGLCVCAGLFIEPQDFLLTEPQDFSNHSFPQAFDAKPKSVTDEQSLTTRPKEPDLVVDDGPPKNIKDKVRMHKTHPILSSSNHNYKLTSAPSFHSFTSGSFKIRNWKFIKKKQIWTPMSLFFWPPFHSFLAACSKFKKKTRSKKHLKNNTSFNVTPTSGLFPFFTGCSFKIENG